jgi:hypothetical protein
MAARLPVQKTLASRLGGLLAFVYERMPVVTGLSAPSPDPTAPNALYDDPIGFALAKVGYPAVDPGSVVDADIGALPASLYYDFLDVAEWRLIQTTLGSFTLTDVTVQDGSESWAVLRKQFQDRADAIAARLGGILASGSVGFVMSTPTPRWGDAAEWSRQPGWPWYGYPR